MQIFRELGLSGMVIAALGCASVEETPDETLSAANCVREPALYDWQRLDNESVIVWTLPSEQAYHLGLATDLRSLTFANALEFVDGNRDGLLCDEGWDSLLAVFNPSTNNQGAAPIRAESAIHFVNPLSAVAVASLQESHAETLGRRVHGSAPSI